MAKGASDYKYHFINSPPDDVVCPLCLDIVEEPYQFTCCGQHICKKCKDKFKQQATTTRTNTSRQTRKCPMCRQSKYSMLPDKYFERNTLNKLLIWCSEGCGQEIELGRLKSHLSQCPCIELDCPNGCGLKVQGQYMAEHKEKCPKRPFICCYCKYQSTYEVVVNEHHPVCDKYLMICPNKCSEDEIERGLLPDHLENCPDQVLECEFSHVGCHEKIRRCDLSKHQSEQGSYHNALYFKVIYESLQMTNKMKDELLQEKDKQLQEKDAQLLEKDKELKEMLRRLEEKDEGVVKKFKKLKEAMEHKDKQLLEIGQQLIDKDKDLQEQLVKKDKELEKTVQQKNQLLSEKDKEISWRDKQLRDKDDKMHTILNRFSKLQSRVVGDTVLSVGMINFKDKKNHAVQWFSPCYFTRPFGYRMCFQVNFHYCFFPHESLCVYSHMMIGPYDDHLLWPFTGKLIVRLLDQCGDDHYDYFFDYTKGNKGKRVRDAERGEYMASQSSYLPFSQLHYNPFTNCKYLENDCLFFSVIILQ